MKWLVLALIAFFGLLVGMVSGLFGGLLGILLVVPLLILCLVIRDFRLGVVCLAFLLPWTGSPLLPQAKGLNIINYLVLAAVIAFGVKALFKRQKIVEVPRPLVWFYLLPLTAAFVLALPHLSEAARNFSGTEQGVLFTPIEYLKGEYLKPLGYVIFAYLLANAVRVSRVPDRFAGVFCVAAMLPALVVFAMVALYHVSLADLQAQRNFMGPIGLHANEMAIMLTFTIGPLLFMLGALRSVVTRFLCSVALAAVTGALLLTFSRGGFVAMVVVLGFYIVQRRRVLTMLICLASMSLALLFAPAAIVQRLSTGVEHGAVANTVGNLTDPLTAGRVAVWERLAPEFLRSPLWGRGLGSTSWSELVHEGVYLANHPHNMYLAVLLDVGVIGFFLLMSWYWRVFRAHWKLQHEPSLSPLMQQFFAGSAASLAGFMIFAFTNGNYTPKPEYTFFWFSVGVLMAYWKQIDPSVSVSRADRAAKRMQRIRGNRMAGAQVNQSPTN